MNFNEFVVTSFSILHVSIFTALTFTSSEVTSPVNNASPVSRSILALSLPAP
jgi:hypothetical protein